MNAGAELLGVPKWNAALTGEYRFFTGTGVSPYIRGAARWVGSSRGSYDPNNPDYSRPSYKTLDASVGASYEAWDVSLFAKNLANDQTVIQRPFVQFLTEAYRQRPRTIGVLVSRKF